MNEANITEILITYPFFIVKILKIMEFSKAISSSVQSIIAVGGWTLSHV